MSDPKGISRQTSYLCNSNSDSKPHNDPLQSIFSAGSFSDMQFNKQSTGIRWHSMEKLNHKRLNLNTLHPCYKKPTSIHRTSQSNFDLTAPEHDAHGLSSLVSPFERARRIKPNTESETSIEVQSNFLEVKAKSNSFPSSRFYTCKKYAILFLLFSFIGLYLYGAMWQGSSRIFPDVLRSKADTLANLIVQKNHNLLDLIAEDISYPEKFFKVLKALHFLITHGFWKFLNKVKNMEYNSTALDTFSLEDKTTIKYELKKLVHEVVEDKIDDIVKKVQAAHSIYQFKYEKASKLHQTKGNKRHCQLKRACRNFCNMTEENIYTQVAEKDTDQKLLAKQGNCCDHKLFLTEYAVPFEKLFLSTMQKMIHQDSENDSSYFFHKWLQSKLARTKEDIIQTLKLEFKTSKDNATQLYNSSKNKEMAGFTRQEEKDETAIRLPISHNKKNLFSVFHKLFNELMLLFDGDKTVLVDFASESAGGRVLTVKQTESYFEKTLSFSFIRYILRLNKEQNSPEAAIQPGLQPGECWAFKGDQGFLVIQLAYIIYPTGFTMEHIPASLSPSGSIDSAPKDFSVWGLMSEIDDEGKLLGQYSYDVRGYFLQYFPAQHAFKQPFKFVELRIHKNHGNPEYTCLYRFRVHGRISKQNFDKAVIF